MTFSSKLLTKLCKRHLLDHVLKLLHKLISSLHVYVIVISPFILLTDDTYFFICFTSNRHVLCLEMMVSLCLSLSIKWGAYSDVVTSMPLCPLPHCFLQPLLALPAIIQPPPLLPPGALTANGPAHVLGERQTPTWHVEYLCKVKLWVQPNKHIQQEWVCSSTLECYSQRIRPSPLS